MVDTWQLYGDQIIAERKKRKSLRLVGSKFGVSGEYIRILLIKHCGTTKISSALSEAEVARKLGVSSKLISRIREDGLTKPQRFNRVWLYPPEQVEDIRKYIEEHTICLICGKPKRPHSVVCATCWTKYRWHLVDNEGKDRMTKASKSWAQRNLDRYKERQRETMRNYCHRRSKEYFEGGHNYIVHYPCQFPIGEIIKVYGCKDSKAVLEDDSLLSWNYLRKMEIGE